MKAVIGQKPWFKDALTIRKPWSEDEYALSEHGYGKGLCFAIMWDDGRVIPDPPVKRGLQEAKDALIVAGHKGGYRLIACNDHPSIYFQWWIGNL